MKKLVVLRHAKSSWSDPTQDDHDRPLNSRGRAAAPVIGSWLAYRRHVPDLVLSSSAVRALQTVAELRKAFPRLPEPIVERGLYHAAPCDMLDRLTDLTNDAGTALLVGHQPGLSALTRKLADGRENRRCRRAYEHFPTAAAAVLELDITDWAGLEFAQGRFVDFAKPRELMDA